MTIINNQIFYFFLNKNLNNFKHNIIIFYLYYILFGYTSAPLPPRELRSRQKLVVVEGGKFRPFVTYLINGLSTKGLCLYTAPYPSPPNYVVRGARIGRSV